MSWDIKKVLTMKENINEVYSIEIQNLSVQENNITKKGKNSARSRRKYLLSIGLTKSCHWEYKENLSKSIRKCQTTNEKNRQKACVSTSQMKLSHDQGTPEKGSNSITDQGTYNKGLRHHHTQPD